MHRKQNRQQNSAVLQGVVEPSLISTGIYEEYNVSYVQAVLQLAAALRLHAREETDRQAFGPAPGVAGRLQRVQQCAGRLAQARLDGHGRPRVGAPRLHMGQLLVADHKGANLRARYSLAIAY